MSNVTRMELLKCKDAGGRKFIIPVYYIDSTLANAGNITPTHLEGSFFSYYTQNGTLLTPITNGTQLFNDLYYYVYSGSQSQYLGEVVFYPSSSPSAQYPIAWAHYASSWGNTGPALACGAIVKTTDGHYLYYASNGNYIITSDKGSFEMPTSARLGYYVVDNASISLSVAFDKTSSEQIANKFLNNMVPSDPYTPGGTSGPGGGDGDGDFSSSDDIDYPGDPGVSAVNTGFISLWAPTEQQMLNLSRYMWNVDITTIDFWKRLWADPMDIIYGVNIIPVDLRATGRTVIGGTEHVIVGLVDTKVDMDYLVTQWVDVDCGTVNISEAWGAYLDYDPYTKLEIYLPYCGYHPLRIDDFMSGSISVKYKIDMLSGACIAMVKAIKPNDDEHNLNSVIYQFMGNCATQIPVTASQFADAVRSTMSLAASIGTMVATGVGGAAAAASKQGLSTVGKAQLASSLIGEGAATVENVMGIKPAIERSGALGGAAGLLAVQTPYLVLTRPRQAHPEEQNKYTGFPSFMTRTLGQCAGWTIVKEIHLDNIPCTSEEMIEIDNLLKEGVIL